MDYKFTKYEKAQEYYKRKFIEWNKDLDGFEDHIRKEDVKNLTNEFNSDKGNLSHDFNDVCRFLKDYEKHQQGDAILKAISFINDSINLSSDVIRNHEKPYLASAI